MQKETNNRSSEKKITLTEIGGMILELKNKIDISETSIIDVVAEDVSELKDETSESFRKVRNDIWNLNDRFVKKQGFKLG